MNTDNNKDVQQTTPLSSSPLQSDIQVLQQMEQKMQMEVPQLRTFDIIVYETDDSGKMSMSPRNGVKAFSAKELIDLYSMDGTKIQIVKAYPPVLPKQPVPPPQTQTNQLSVVPSEKYDGSKNALIKNDISVINEEPELENKEKEEKLTPTVKPVEEKYPEKEKDKPSPPKIFVVNGVKCKLENGKIFQERWVKVKDASRFRVVSDSTGNVVKLTNKHIETLDWVVVDNGN